MRFNPELTVNVIVTEAIAAQLGGESGGENLD